MSMALSVTTLYLEELKATMRGRFAWLGAAVILFAIGALATVGTQDTWLDGYGIIAYGLVPPGDGPGGGRDDCEPPRKPVCRVCFHGARGTARLAGGQVSGAGHRRGRLLRGFAADDAGVHLARRDASASAQVSAMDSGVAAREPRGRHAGRRALHRAEPGCAVGCGHGSAAGLCGLIHCRS